MKHLLHCLLTLLCLGSLSLQAAEGTQRELPGRSPSFIPRGLYWAGEYIWRDDHEAIDWPRVEASFVDLAAHHVNALWITHLSPQDTAECSRRAALHDIHLVASIAELDGSVPHIRVCDYQALINQTMQAWGDAPKPIAWGLGDEPREDYMSEMANYVAAWRDHAPGEPVTTVVMYPDVAAASRAGFDQVAADIYPFFSEGNPNAFMQHPAQAWITHARRLTLLGARPWMMGQAFQEPWGPYTTNSSGHVVYLPGGAAHWVTPTPEQISWQALSALTLACKGMFYFHYRAPALEDPLAEAAELPATVQTRTDSGSPIAMVLPDGGTTPQYEAMSEAFAWIAAHADTLAPLVSVPAPEAWESQAAPGSSHVINMLIDPTTKQRWLMIVAGYQSSDAQVHFVVGPHITALTEHLTGAPVALTAELPFRVGAVRLAPGTAILLKCQVDAARLPISYADHFFDDRFQTDALQITQVRRHGDGVLSANGAETPAEAFAVYDLERWFPAATAGSLRLLHYDGAAVPEDLRGAFWYSSPDAVTWTALSANEFNVPRPCSDRYLKVCLSWSQSSDAYAYGRLSQFSIVHWPAP